MPETDESFTPFNPGVALSPSDEVVLNSSLLSFAATADDAVKILALSQQSNLSLDNLVTLRPQRALLHEVIIATTEAIQMDAPEDSISQLGDLVRSTIRRVHQRLIKHAGPAFQQCADTAAKVRANIEWEIAELRKRGPAEQDMAVSSLLSGIETGGYELTDEIKLRMVQGRAINQVWREIKPLLAQDADLAWRALAAASSAIACNHMQASICHKFAKERLPRVFDELSLGKLKKHKEPHLFTVKGPPASGKTSMRKSFAQLAEKLGFDWADVMKVNPDIWRSLFLDKRLVPQDMIREWGNLTDTELSVVYHKMSDRLYDDDQSNLMVDHLFPAQGEYRRHLNNDRIIYNVVNFARPESLIERSFKRGNEMGRYIAPTAILMAMYTVYNTMIRELKNVRRGNFETEIVWNETPLGVPPLRVATLDYKNAVPEASVFRPDLLMEIDRTYFTNIEAKSAEELAERTLPPATKDWPITNYMQTHCHISFVDVRSHVIYASMDIGKPLCIHDHDLFEKHCENSQLLVVLGQERGLRDGTLAPRCAVTGGLHLGV